LGLEAGVAGGAQERVRVQATVDVLHAAATAADGVLVGLEASVVKGGCPRLDPAGESELDEQLEGGVDRRHRDARELLMHGAVDLLGGRVLFAAAELAEDHEALGGNALPPAMQELD
jgi:hypothetical protein